MNGPDRAVRAPGEGVFQFGPLLLPKRESKVLHRFDDPADLRPERLQLDNGNKGKIGGAEKRRTQAKAQKHERHRLHPGHRAGFRP